MDELQRALHLLVAGEAVLHPVLDGLDVVVGPRLDGLDRRGVPARKLIHKLVQCSDGLCTERLQLHDGGLGGQRLQPLDFDPQAIADQRGLTEMHPQGVDGTCVAAVEGGQRIQLR